VLVWAADRLARRVRHHFLEVLDTLNHLGIEFVSLRENLETGGPARQSGRGNCLCGCRAGP
jgi:DNA invertase Pin-like site-specific DNA recombinase